MQTATKLKLGRIVITPGIECLLNSTDADQLLQKSADLGYLIWRHETGDWGEVDAEDKQTNDEALELGNRVLSAYQFQGQKVWIITEADRSATTVLLPEEY